MSEWIRTISSANVASCEPFPHKRIRKPFLTVAPNKCPKSVLKTTRIDFSLVRYTFVFCVTLLTLIVMQVSLWLFLSCMRVLIASTRSVMEEYSPGSR